jgi:predicted dehydrogenase
VPTSHFSERTIMFQRRHFLAGLSTLSASAGLPAWNPQAWAATPSKIKIGQIGVGHAHATKLSVYRQSDAYEVVGIVEPDEKLRERAQFLPAYRDLKWMTQEELLNLAGLQAVLVETQVRDLLDVAELCVTAGKHVHIDKPAGSSLPHFERVLKMAEKQGLLVQMGYMYRYNPAVIMLRDCLNNGWLGDIFEVHAVMSKVVNSKDRPALAEFSGGILFELGCHVLDLVIGVLGEPKSVSGHSRHSSTIDDQLQDNMLAVLDYPQAMATIKSSAIEVNGESRRHLVVCGTEGTFHIQPLDNPTAKLTLSSDRQSYKKGIQEISFPKYARYVDDAADMARIIRGEKAADFSYQHDLIVQRTLLQACKMPLT